MRARLAPTDPRNPMRIPIAPRSSTTTEPAAAGRWRWVTPMLVVMAACALGFTKTDDFDGWWHLALGREIVGRRGFPANEPLNFPSFGLPFYDVEWLFHVVLYLAYAAAGFAGVTVLKSLAAGASALILWKDATLRLPAPVDRRLHVVVTAVVLFPTLLVVEPRIVERPDLFVMIFLPLTVYALNAYVREDRARLLYLLPAVQVVWINTHPSAVLAAVPFGAVLVGGVIQRYRERRGATPLPDTPRPDQLRTIAVVFLAVAGASLLNPYGYRPLLVPLELLQSSFLMDVINELQPPTFRGFPVFFVMVALLAVTFVARVSHLSLASVLLVLPFAYQGLTSVRFMFLFGLVAAPILVRNLVEIEARLALDRGRVPVMTGARTAAVLGASLVILGLARVVPLVDPRRTPGYGVNAQHVPEGALRYLDRAGFEGRLYNTFSMGGYIEWRDFPRRTPIVDGRGYLPAGMFEEVHHARAYSQHLDQLQARYDFDVAVVDYPVVSHFTAEWVSPDHDFAWASRRWALVYWDDHALVYLRRSERWRAIIERDEYRHVKPGNGPSLLVRKLDDPRVARAIEVELRRNVAETGSSVGLTLLGFVALQSGAFDEALAAFRNVHDSRALPGATEGRALAHWRRGQVPEALEAYRSRLALGEEPRLLFSVGVCLITLDRAREAIPYLERARARDPLFAPLYPALLDAYRRAGVSGPEDDLATGYTAALNHARATEHVARARQHQQTGHLEAAAGELASAIEAEPGNAVAVSQLGYVRLLLGLVEDAITQQQAALQLNPRLAQAHYGLGLAYRARGDHRLAREHFTAYARLEPKTYYAWRVRHDFGTGP